MIEIEKINTKCWFSGIALLALLLMPQQLSAETLKIDQVMAFPTELNISSAGQYASIKYTLSDDAQTRIIIYGPQQEQIKLLQDWTSRPAGVHSARWDGKDNSGTIAGDEAYFFTIEAKNQDNTAVYDPIITSGGTRVTPQNVALARSDNKISYTLPRTSRVLVRAGMDTQGVRDMAADEKR